MKLDKVEGQQTTAIAKSMYARYAEGLLLTIPSAVNGAAKKVERKKKVNAILKKVENKVDMNSICPGVAQLVNDIKQMNDLATDEDAS